MCSSQNDWTISDFISRQYTLDFPNAEVKVGFMENFLSRIMGIVNANTEGFADMFYRHLFMSDATYVLELKMRESAEKAMEQIESNDYAIPYQGSGKPVVKIGIAFSQETKTVSEWKVKM